MRFLQQINLSNFPFQNPSIISIKKYQASIPDDQSRSRSVPTPPPVVNKLQQTHQKQNPHIFSMQSWSWSGAGSQEPCCILDNIILTNTSPKISETDRDKVYFCREKKTGKKDCKKDGWKNKIYRARKFWLVRCQRTCQGCALSCRGEQHHETNQEKKHSYSQLQKHEQVTKQQHENHACHRKWFDGSRKKIPSLSHTKNCKVPKRKRTLQLISDELPHPPDLKLNKCRLYSAQIKTQQLLRYQTKRASDGRIRCRNGARTNAPKMSSRFKHPQSRIQIWSVKGEGRG